MVGGLVCSLCTLCTESAAQGGLATRGSPSPSSPRSRLAKSEWREPLVWRAIKIPFKILKPCICTNPSQDWYSGDIIRALELSGSLVPQVKFHTFLIDWCWFIDFSPSQNLRDMFEGFKLRMAQEGKKVKSGGGFGGSGFKFDETEAT